MLAHVAAISAQLPHPTAAATSSNPQQPGPTSATPAPPPPPPTTTTTTTPTPSQPTPSLPLPPPTQQNQQPTSSHPIASSSSIPQNSPSLVARPALADVLAGGLPLPSTSRFMPGVGVEAGLSANAQGKRRASKLGVGPGASSLESTGSSSFLSRSFFRASSPRLVHADI